MLFFVLVDLVQMFDQKQKFGSFEKYLILKQGSSMVPLDTQSAISNLSSSLICASCIESILAILFGDWWLLAAAELQAAKYSTKST